jgi:hypothetical protein
MAAPRDGSDRGSVDADGAGAATRTGKKVAVGSAIAVLLPDVDPANWRRQRNNRLEWMLCRRATSETVAPARPPQRSPASDPG